MFRRVARGTHADLLTVERVWDEKRKRQRTEIVVEGARDIAGFLRLTPAEGGWRVVVVDGAEHLNRNAANALLKVLEEPPARAVLLLTCAAPGRLLPTIRSRCRRLPLRSAGRRTRWTGRWSACCPSRTRPPAPGLAAIAAGSPGRAVLLAEEGGVAIAALVDEVLRAAPRCRSRAPARSPTGSRAATAPTRRSWTCCGTGSGGAVREAARGRGDRLDRRRAP